MMSTILLKQKWIFALGVLTLCGAAWPEDVRLSKSEYSEVTEITGFKKTSHYALRHFPLDAKDDFSLFFKVDIQDYRHYGTVRIGLSHSVYPRRLTFELTKPDSGKRYASVQAALLPSFSFKHKTFELPADVNSYLFSIEHKSDTRSVRWSRFSLDGEMLDQTPWVKIREELTFDRLSIWAQKNKEDSEKARSAVEVNGDQVEAASKLGKAGQYLLTCSVSKIHLEDGVGEKPRKQFLKSVRAKR
ncbi:MAG: hypothetical protein ABJZ55_14590 [Fuerstiella sp.]